MSRIAPSILEDMESLNKTPIPDLKDKLTELMKKRMNQSLEKEKFENLKIAEICSSSLILTNIFLPLELL
ncbi:MAG: hypothetical protein HYT97_07875 [Elusimicrobia bacterium]|nr:hypothetical protein [Elusimicrobiota bacterium]